MKSKLPERKQLRYKDFDYSNPGYYFITICSDDKEEIFGRIEKGKMILSEYGWIVDKCWNLIPEHFTNVELDQFQIMPNHLHGIIIINPVGDGSPIPYKGKQNNMSPIHDKIAIENEINSEKINVRDGKPVPNVKNSRLSDIVAYFKYMATKEVNLISKTPGKKIFQRSFYDRIIRNEKELYNIRKYIIENPLRWKYEKETPENLDMSF